MRLEDVRFGDDVLGVLDAVVYRVDDDANLDLAHLNTKTRQNFIRRKKTKYELHLLRLQYNTISFILCRIQIIVKLAHLCSSPTNSVAIYTLYIKEKHKNNKNNKTTKS